MRIGITGPNGRLGSELVTNWGGERIDGDICLLSENQLSEFDVIINCAAYTKVDACEVEFKRAIQVNMRGAERLRTAFSGTLFHISTDYVFSGNKGPYSEEYNKYEPVNAYGWSKYAGEIVLRFPAVESDRKQTIIVRTTGLFGGCSGRNDFVKTIRQELEKGNPIKVSNELYGNQTYIPWLAEALIKLADGKWGVTAPPIINIGSDDVITRYEFAVMIANMWGYNPSLITPCKNNDIPGWIAKRPTRGGLKTLLAKRLRLPICSTLDGLRAYKNDTGKI